MRTLLFRLDCAEPLEDDLKGLLRDAQLFGWIRRHAETVEILVQGTRWGIVRLFNELPDHIDSRKVHVRELEGWPQTERGLRVLPPVPTGGPVAYGCRLDAADPRCVVGCLDRVDHRGHLIGWALDTTVPGKVCELELTIDGAIVGVVTAGAMRDDLPALGIGWGRNGIDVPVPEVFRDGRSHRFSASPVEPVAAKGALSRELRIPATISVPTPKPWVRQLSESKSQLFSVVPSEAEYALQEGRQRILSGDISEGFPAVRYAYDLAPSLVFRDIGLREYHRESGTRFVGIRERMSDRWQAWYGQAVCNRLPTCCKLDGLVSEGACHWWPRLFESKQRTKEWAKASGFPVPETYKVTEDVEGALRDLDIDRFVLKPVNDSGRGLYLMQGNLNLFDRYRYSPEDLMAMVQAYRLKRGAGSTFLIEELLVQEQVSPTAPVLPLDYKLHVFGGKVRLVHVDDRNRATRDPLSRQQAWFSRDWTPAPFRLRENEVEGEMLAKPSCYERMLSIAEAIGERAGAHVRVDAYATDRGVVLGEITTYSFGGNGYTAEGDLVLSQLWELYEADARLEQSLYQLLSASRLPLASMDTLNREQGPLG